ncbi:MAG: hypothetical protein WBE20_06055 [Candidatus Acidiferrales bacterium]
MNSWRRIGIGACVATLAIGLPAFAYEYPLSSSAIRDAYFKGTGTGRGGADFLAEYSHKIPELTAGAYTSIAKIETPYAQVAERAAETLSYTADDAVRDFLGKPEQFRIYLDLCGKSGGEKAFDVKVTQHGKEIAPDSVHRSPYYAAQDPYTRLPRIGEHIEMDFRAGKIASETLTIKIDVPDGEQAETTFDLATIK